jgi:Domain of unknown function (DUF4157)
VSRSAALLHTAMPQPAGPAISNLAARAPVIQRSCAACGAGKSGDDKCPACDDPRALGAVQAKLAIGAPEDPLEKEADEVADKVMRMPIGCGAPAIARADGLEGALRRKPAGPTATASAMFAAALRRRSGGAPLSTETRGFFEPRFARDFGHVRLHDGASSGALAREINARAFTHRSDIYFAPGQYDPTSAGGRRLLAHELTHVLQQRADIATVQRKPLPNDPLKYDRRPRTVTAPANPITLAEAKQQIDDAIALGELSAGAVSGAQPGSVEEIMLYYILANTGGEERWGTQVDLIAPIGFKPKGTGVAPVGKVAVLIDKAGRGEAILVSKGAPVTPKLAATPQEAEAKLKSLYGIGGVEDGTAKWSLEQLNLMLGAFARVPPADIVALKGVILVRVERFPMDPKDPNRETEGEFGSKQEVNDTTVTNRATLTLATSVFPPTPTNFVGGQGTEASDAYYKILHEVGHAVASKTYRDATHVSHKAVATTNALADKQNEANALARSAYGVYEPAYDQLKVLEGEANKAQAALDKAEASGNQAAIDAAKAPLSAKDRAFTAKQEEVSAKQSAYQKLVAQRDEAKAQTDAATLADQGFYAKAEDATARPVLLARAKVAESAATTALGAADGVVQAKSTNSSAYRKAVADVGKVLADLAKILQVRPFNSKERLTWASTIGELRARADTAFAAAESARNMLAKSRPNDPALAAFAPVAVAQRAWFEALALVIDAGNRPQRVQKFVDFVKAKGIEPFTAYAQQEWPHNPEDFFTEAYTLFLNHPKYLEKNFPVLHAWFAAGSYR